MPEPDEEIQVLRKEGSELYLRLEGPGGQVDGVIEMLRENRGFWEETWRS